MNNSPDLKIMKLGFEIIYDADEHHAVYCFLSFARYGLVLAHQIADSEK
jgi:hypothetical protein